MKKYFAIALTVVMLFSMLTACSESANGSAFGVTIINSSGYAFNELYVASTESDSWGENRLDNAGDLENEGSFEVQVSESESDRYDIRIIDEEDDEYLFESVKLLKDCKVNIGFNGGLFATVTYSDDTSYVVEGTLNGEGEATNGEDSDDVINTEEPVEEDKEFFFAVYNQSDYDILYIYMGPASGSADDDIDVLPTILTAGERTDITGTVPASMASITEWTLYIKDTDGDTSSTYETFNPFTVAVVDIYWDAEAGGYRCDFTY